jgi:hypothetical protein
MLEEDCGSRSRQAESDASLRQRRLLAHAVLEVAARDRFDLRPECLVHGQLPPGFAREELDRPVVMRRAEAP